MNARPMLLLALASLACDDGAVLPDLAPPALPPIAPIERPPAASCGDGVADPGVFCPTAPEALPGRVQASRVIAVDWNADRRLDLVAAGYEGTVRVWAQSARRRLLEATVLAAPREPIDVAAGDFDGDGDVDLAVAGVGARALWVYWQRAGGFVRGPEVALPGTPFGLAAGDLDGDGRVDLAVADFSRGGLTTLRSTGEGFEAAFEPTGIEPHGLTLRDVDGDGHLDGLVANAGRHDAGRDTVSVRFGDGRGGFSGGVDLEVGNGPFWVDAADLDGDGHLDLVAANYGTPLGGHAYAGGDTISVLRGLGDRRFAPALDWPTGNGPTHLALADVDRDGHVDVITADRGDFDFARRVARGGATLTVLHNDGAAGFAERTTIALPAAPLGVAAADLDADGSVELCAAALDDWRVYVVDQAP